MATTLLTDIIAPSSIVTLNGTQTLTNKTLTSPSLTSPTMSAPTITGTLTAGGTTVSTNDKLL